LLPSLLTIPVAAAIAFDVFTTPQTSWSSASTLVLSDPTLVPEEEVGLSEFLEVAQPKPLNLHFF